MSNQIKVSVIIPVYNVENYLAQCLDSIINQTLKEIEIICVDDGSTDGSVDILNKYALKDPRMKVINQKNSGAGAARNKGISAASGDYMIFLDSDDFFEYDMIETAYNKAIEENSDIVVFNSDQYYEDSDTFKNISWTIRKKAIPPYSPFTHFAFTDNVFKVFVGWAWDKLFKSEFVLKNNLTFQEQRTSNDLLFVFSAVVLADKISIADKILAHQRRNIKDSLSNTRERSWDCFYHALVALKNNLISYNLMNELTQDYINYALHFSLWQLETITGPKKEVLYNKLRNEWFEQFGIKGKPSRYFYNKNEYKKFVEIESKTFEQYNT